MTRSDWWFLLVAASAALGVYAGRLGDTSLRDPRALLVFCAWLISVFAVLIIGYPHRPPPEQ